MPYIIKEEKGNGDERQQSPSEKIQKSGRKDRLMKIEKKKTKSSFPLE